MSSSEKASSTATGAPTATLSSTTTLSTLLAPDSDQHVSSRDGQPPVPRRVGVFGWGIVAPKSPNIAAFAQNLEAGQSWLTPFEGFGPSNFLVGQPEFEFETYKPWIDARFAPRHYQNLKEKMDMPSLYAIGAFIQALEQNPGLEQLMQELGSQAQVYLGTGLGAIETIYQSSVTLHLAQQRWNRFWGSRENNSALSAYLAGENRDATDVPRNPEEAEGDLLELSLAWEAYWTQHSPELREYLAEGAAIDSLEMEGGVEQGKLHILRERSKRHARLQEKWGTPEPPWKVSANLIWNIHNTPASQVSILGRITGLAFAPVAACSTFGVALRLAMQAIQHGEAKVVVIGATDPPPHPLVVGSFYGARVLSASRQVSNPLTQLQGTHVAGGAVVWIVGDMEYLESRGMQPLGMEPIAAGVSSDAHHIITPSVAGPQAAIRQAIEEARTTPEQINTWDLHATATPGDYAEISTLRTVLPETVMVTARKGTFGHGMSAGGGWELTAQYLGYATGHLFPTLLTPETLNPSIAGVHGHYVFADSCVTAEGLAGKLSSGIGGVNACVISRPLRK
jgi:3-oxoacyl-[acyl-carrier-protein] synthase II